MLLNLSNHPSDHWPDSQKQAAIDRFGEIADLPFPAIDPDADENTIAELAHKYANQCIEQLNNAAIEQFPLAVHIMGELTFCFAVVSLLQQKGIKCIASTTTRVASQNGNIRTSEFNFVRFRNYPLIKKQF